MRRSQRFPTKEDDIYEGRYACVECKTGRQMGTFAHIPPEAFPLYDGHKGKKFCCKEHWGVMIRKLVQLVSSLPSRKRGRLEDAASPPSTPIATPTTPKPLPNGFEERDVILCDACAKYPSQHEENMDSHLILKGAIKAIKASSTFQYAGLRVGGNRASSLDQIEAVPEPYEARDLSFAYKA